MIDKPSVDTDSAEDTKVEVADTVSKADAEVIIKTLSKAQVSSIVESSDMKKLFVDNGIENTPTDIKVVSTVNVEKSSLSGSNQSITYEISPAVVFTLNGEEKTIALKNKYINGSVQITLPLNGVKLKEIIHESADGTKEYIHSDKFTINSDDTVTFAVTHFSSFTLSNTVTAPVVEKPFTTVSPNTGDHTDMMLYGGLGVAAMIGAVALILFRRKHA